MCCCREESVVVESVLVEVWEVSEKDLHDEGCSISLVVSPSRDDVENEVAEVDRDLRAERLANNSRGDTTRNSVVCAGENDGGGGVGESNFGELARGVCELEERVERGVERRE